MDGDKYSLRLTGASNLDSKPIDSVIKIINLDIQFTCNVQNNGAILSNITTKYVNARTGYIHIPLPAYSTLQVQSPIGVELELKSELMP